MSVDFVRRAVMEYRGQEFQYELDHIEQETGSIRQQEQAKTYRRKRSLHSTRRRSSKSSSHPGCGIGGRRNRRWSW